MPITVEDGQKYRRCFIIVEKNIPISIHIIVDDPRIMNVCMMKIYY